MKILSGAAMPLWMSIWRRSVVFIIYSKVIKEQIIRCLLGRSRLLVNWTSWTSENFSRLPPARRYSQSDQTKNGSWKIQKSLVRWMQVQHRLWELLDQVMANDLVAEAFGNTGVTLNVTGVSIVWGFSLTVRMIFSSVRVWLPVPPWVF